MIATLAAFWVARHCPRLMEFLGLLIVVGLLYRVPRHKHRSAWHLTQISHTKKPARQIDKCVIGDFTFGN